MLKFNKKKKESIKESIKRKATDDDQKRSRSNSLDSCDEYLMAMKRVFKSASIVQPDMQSPRQRYRTHLKYKTDLDLKSSWDLQEATRISTIISMVPDEVIYNHMDYSVKTYETALMFIDISGFTELCETYTKTGKGGPSKLTQVLNSYIGAIVQEVLSHNGDVLKFSGDAFLSMWKRAPKRTMQNIVHTAIDCGLTIQKNYGTHVTDVGVTLRVKVAIAAGICSFSLIGDESVSSFVVVGQPVWDLKTAEYVSTAGDVITTASVWMYVNDAEYVTIQSKDGLHRKVVGVGVTWKRVEKFSSILGRSSGESELMKDVGELANEVQSRYRTRGYSLRPSVTASHPSSWVSTLRRFMLTPVLRAVENDEPMDFLTEIRHVVVVCLNIITKPVTDEVLINIVKEAFEKVQSVTSANFGLVNKISMFDKDMMFLIVFGLRGLKQEDEARTALLCALELKQTLVAENINTISIGVTCGTAYCGVVGHVLRREYTVIGSAVNKAARLMMAYKNKVACDKETFVQSKLPLDYFQLMPFKSLKGIANPGPVYEFNKEGWSDRKIITYHPLLGRNEETKKYVQMLQKALDKQTDRGFKTKDLKYGIVVQGPPLAGKTRLIEEFLNLTPDFIRVDKIALFEKDDVKPFRVTKIIMSKLFAADDVNDQVEKRIRQSISFMSLSPLQFYALNVIFDCRFPLPEHFEYGGDILDDVTVKSLIFEICKHNFPTLRVIAIKEAGYMDEESWRVLIMLMESKALFIVLTISDGVQLTRKVKKCLSESKIMKMVIGGIDRWYHSALACQLLDVQAIPADLEKVIECASGGLPGWIQNFIISLVQRGDLSVVTVPRNEAVEAGAVLPLPILLQRREFSSDTTMPTVIRRQPSLVEPLPKQGSQMMARGQDSIIMSENDMIQMAVLPDGYNFDDINVNMTMDVIILTTFDSLTPFEKMLLKCGSVLGEIFSRRMLLHLLQSDSPRNVSKAVARLFSIRVLECEGGDFTRTTSDVLIHPGPALPNAKHPYCRCLGITHPHDSRDLPSYAFCGYMKFRHSLFRTTTYQLLTENQKHEMHTRALRYLELNTRRCSACGGGCFAVLFGVRCDDGLIAESAAMKKVQEQIVALGVETGVVCEQEHAPLYGLERNEDVGATSSEPYYETIQVEEKRRLPMEQLTGKVKHVRSFSSLELSRCECMAILLSVYGEVLDHFRAVDDCIRLYETYIEYADLSIINLNIPQALRLLSEVEAIIRQPGSIKKTCGGVAWIKRYKIGRILTLRATCMLESGDVDEARVNLLNAMTAFSDPFPTSKIAVKFRHMRESIHQHLLLTYPSLFVGTESYGVSGLFYVEVTRTLSKLYRLYASCREHEKAEIAAKWALKYALKANFSFRRLCVCYADMIQIYRQNKKFKLCLKLEKSALEICSRKRGQLDVMEVYAVCSLYTNIFLFYVEYGRKLESLEFGLSVIPLMTSYSDISTCQMLVLWMLKLLLSDMRIHEMVMIMREFFYLNDNYDLSSETWYYVYAVVILLDTGYCVESYGTCERFYIKKGDAIFRAKTPEAAWNFFVSMWLVTIRVGAWERSILWEEKIQEILYNKKFLRNEFMIMLLLRLVEGYLITLTNEMNNRNIRKVRSIQKSIKTMFDNIKHSCRSAAMYKPRYLLLFAYYHYLKGQKSSAFKYLNEAAVLAKSLSHVTLLTWIQHTHNHWKGTLNKKLVDYWAEHIEADNLLDYRDFDPEKTPMVPYTLPLPKDIE